MRNQQLLSKKESSQSHSSNYSLWQPVVHVNYSLLSLFLIFLAMGLLLANNYKVYGSTKIDDDHFLTLVGSFGSVANGCTRAIWALFFDKFGFRKVYFVLLAIQVSREITLLLILTTKAILTPTFQFVSSSKALFLVWHCILMSCEGGHFAMFPSVTAKVFGLK